MLMMSAQAPYPRAQLVARLKLRDPAAFSEFYDQYSRVIYNLCYRLVGTPQDAEDLTQEAFLKAYQQIGSLREPEYLPTWLYRLAHNLCLDALRRGKKERSAVELDVEREEELTLSPDPRAEISPEHQAEIHETSAQVATAVEDLPYRYRTALLLREMEGLSYDEIAQVLDTSVPAVETLLVRARDKFRSLFLTRQLAHTTHACTPFSNYLVGWHMQALPAKRRARVAEHLQHCHTCQSTVKRIEQESNRYRAFVPLVPPLALKATLLGQLAGFSTVAATVGISAGVSTAVVSLAAVAAVLIGAVTIDPSVFNPAFSDPTPSLVPAEAPLSLATISVIVISEYTATAMPTISGNTSSGNNAPFTPSVHRPDAPLASDTSGTPVPTRSISPFPAATHTPHATADPTAGQYRQGQTVQPTRGANSTHTPGNPAVTPPTPNRGSTQSGNPGITPPTPNRGTTPQGNGSRTPTAGTRQSTRTPAATPHRP